MSVNTFREDEEQKVTIKKAVLFRLFRYLLDYKGKIVLVLMIMLVTTGIAMVNPLLIERAIDVHIAQRDVAGLLRLSAFAVVLNLVLVAGMRLRIVLMASVSNEILMKIREELYVHIQTLGFHFFDSRPTGKILARIIGDVNSLKEVLSDSVVRLLPDLMTILGVVLIMMLKDWRLAMSALITLPVLGIGTLLIQKATHRRWQIVRRKTSNMTAFIHENLSGIRIVQSFCAEQESMDDFDVLLEEHRNAFVDAVRWSDTFGPLIDINWGLGGFFLYFIGIRMIGVGQIGVGTFVACSTYLSMFWSPIRNLANFYNKIVTNLSAAERIFEILDTEPEIEDGPESVNLPEIAGEVRFEDVSFAYEDEPDKMVLEHVSFTANPGETIALVGPTGAGKTTIVNLISRFYDISLGNIYIDGYNLKDVTMKSLRSQMGVMTQENFLFSGTVRDNIRYGKLDATDEEIIAAAKAVNAHDFIMKLEKGYDTEISERGGSLSVGQRQLLAFARTMVSRPAILVLDEATSSIDTHTEILVQKGIEALLAGRTSFVIAHRLSTIQNADRIFVIDRGGIVEEGSHEELMAAGGEYYELYQAQFKNIQDEESEEV